MQRQSVTSSNVRSVGYDRATQTLEMEFHSGGIYQYHGVSESEYRALVSAGSVGSYFHAHIKDRYPYTRVS